MKRDKLPALTTVFYLIFAIWFIALRYQAPSFYRWSIGAPFENILHLAVLASLFGILMLVLIGALRERAIPLIHVLVVAGAILLAEIVWRFWVSRGPADFKLIGMIMDVATPLVAGLGIWAFVSEFRKRQTPAVAHSNSTIT